MWITYCIYINMPILLHHGGLFVCCAAVTMVSATTLGMVIIGL
jgi:hypothetical protein